VRDINLLIMNSVINFVWQTLKHHFAISHLFNPFIYHTTIDLKEKLNRVLSGIWLGRHDQTALTSGKGKKQRWSGCASSFEPMHTDIYCDVCITILCVQTIRIIPGLLNAMKYVNVVLCKSVDLVWLGSNARDRRGVLVKLNFPPKNNALIAILNVFLILTDGNIFLLYYFYAHAYATNDRIVIHHVYKPNFAVCVPFFHHRKLGPICHQIGGRVRFGVLSGDCIQYNIILQTSRSTY